MNERLQEFSDSRGVALRVDRNEGVLRGVKLIGYESRNCRRYLPETLAAAVVLYEGAKVNVNHAKAGALAARDYQDRIGVVRNVSARSGEGLFGDLHFNPKHALAEQLLWDAEHAPENVGFSHNVEARTKRDGEQTVVEAIVRVHSVDLVADPATTRGLFENQSAPTIEELSVDLLRLARPDLVNAIVGPLQSEIARLSEELARRTTTTPVSREQGLVEELALHSFDTAGFVRAIT
jgi:hypothetical protein